MRAGGGGGVGEGEFERMAHTGGGCSDMKGMFERTGGSEMNIIRKKSKIKYRGLKEIFKVFVFG